MTATTGKTTDDERGLLPYPVIIAATKGEPQAMNIACRHYAGYIAHLSMRKLRDERGNTYYGIDEDIRGYTRSPSLKAYAGCPDVQDLRMQLSAFPFPQTRQEILEPVL